MLITLMFMALFGAPLSAPGANSPVKRAGHFMVSMPWCGGAAPPPGADHNLVPDVQRFAIKRGDRNTVSTPVAFVDPDGQGAFTVSLPAGTYCVVPASLTPVPPSEARLKAAATGAIVAPGSDFQCLDAVWAECLAVWHLTDANPSPLEVLRYGTCSWHRRCGPPGPAPP